jgi:hypothetical protein
VRLSEIKQGEANKLQLNSSIAAAPPVHGRHRRTRLFRRKARRLFSPPVAVPPVRIGSGLALQLHSFRPDALFAFAEG